MKVFLSRYSVLFLLSGFILNVIYANCCHASGKDIERIISKFSEAISDSEQTILLVKRVPGDNFSKNLEEEMYDLNIFSQKTDQLYAPVLLEVLDSLPEINQKYFVYWASLKTAFGPNLPELAAPSFLPSENSIWLVIATIENDKEETYIKTLDLADPRDGILSNEQNRLDVRLSDFLSDLKEIDSSIRSSSISASSNFKFKEKISSLLLNELLKSTGEKASKNAE